MNARETWIAIALAAPSLALVTCTGGAYPPPCAAGRSDDCSPPAAAAALSCDPGGRMAEALSRVHRFEQVACGARGVVLLGPGTEEPHPEDLAALQSALGLELFEMPGVQSTGRGLCCYPDPEPVEGGCVAIAVDQCGSPVDSIAAFVNERAHALGLGDKRLRVAVRLTGANGPRCTAADPRCGPVESEDYEGPGYAPHADREPVFGLKGGACGHDGDCKIGGFSDHCLSWTEPAVESIGLTHGRLRAAFCGCVEGHCVWFEQ